MSNLENSSLLQGGSLSRVGRPTGSFSTEPSTLASRVRAVLGMTQEDFAREIGVREKTVCRYEKLAIIPKNGAVRTALERLAVKSNVAIKEKE